MYVDYTNKSPKNNLKTLKCTLKYINKKHTSNIPLNGLGM